MNSTNNKTIRHTMVMHGPVSGWEEGQAVGCGKIQRTYHETTVEEMRALLEATRKANPGKIVGIQYNR